MLDTMLDTTLDAALSEAESRRVSTPRWGQRSSGTIVVCTP